MSLFLSCITPKTTDEDKPTQEDMKLIQNKAQNSIEVDIHDLRQWSESFDNVMSSSHGRQTFGEFLRTEFSEENLLFWLAVDELQKIADHEKMEEKCRDIYEDFISILSPKEVSLDAQVREIVNRKMMRPSRHTFDEAQLQIYTLMQRDSYPRFLNSETYKRLFR